MTISGHHRGRFAPSPTGPLHLGSLVAALGSYLDARSRRGQWFVRIEDIDPPRQMHGASDRILRSLEAHGLTWDGAVMYQSRRIDAYREALDRLGRAGLLYPCACTRKEIADSQRRFAHTPSDSTLIYPGTCRSGLAPGRQARAQRVRVDDVTIQFHDRIQGRITQKLAAEVGDFVLHRADGLVAYQLAVVVDDAAQAITSVVRGADLLDSTARQIYLQQLLGLSTPEYAHLPVVVDAAGEKLSKQTRAVPLNDDAAVMNLLLALRFLGIAPDVELGRPSEVLEWAQHRWDLSGVPGELALPEPLRT